MARKRKSQGAPKKGSKPERHSDNAFKFRILDLSAETRKRIYEFALTLKEPGGCSTNLLLTCKQINEEATPYWYKNTAKLHFHTARVDPFGEETTAALHIAREKIKFHSPHCEIEWPKFLCRVESLSFRAIYNNKSIF